MQYINFDKMNDLINSIDVQKPVNHMENTPGMNDSLNEFNKGTDLFDVYNNYRIDMTNK